MHADVRKTRRGDELVTVVVHSCLIPVEEVEGHPAISLRLDPTANNQAKRVRWAHDYELRAALKRHWAVG